jgi:Domain of unknown function (DUF929)
VTDRRPNKRPQYKGGKRVQARGSNRTWWILIAVVVVIAVALVVTLASQPKSADKAEPAPAALVAKVTSLPAGVFDRIGLGTVNGTPKPITAPALTAGGKPHILYVGAEYCPYCATERWPMVIALSRFGSFTGLGTTHSSTTDVFPNTATFTFHGASYTSRWIAFTGVELETNQRQGDGYAPLDKLTDAQQQLFETYDAPPYTTSSGGIPFIDFGGRFIVSGVTYLPNVLADKSAEQIADALADPSTTISKGAIGAANSFTVAICSLTKNQPASVCATPVIKRLASSLQ